MLNQVADGVWVRQSEWVWTNSIVVRGEDGLTLVDPGIEGSELEELADEVDRLGLPVVAGFCTHPHWDHLLWHSRFGEVPRYGTAACAQLASKAREQAREAAAESASGVELELVAVVAPLPADGGPIPGEIIEHQAHAVGHAAILLEDRGVLLAGDMFSDVLVPLLDSRQDDQVGAYETAFDRLSEAVGQVEVVVPGHGAVAEGSEVAARLAADRAYIEALRRGQDPATRAWTRTGSSPAPTSRTWSRPEGGRAPKYAYPVRPLRYSINVTLDGCCDHRAISPDEEMHRHATEILAEADALIFGRVTYEMMEAAWRPPGQMEEMPDWTVPFGQTIDAAKKYVVSSTLDQVDWNAELLRGDLGEEVQKLKQEPGEGLLVGGLQLPLALADLGLIDEYEFVVHPRVVGHGPRLLEGLSKNLDLKLLSREEFGSGAVVTRYEPRGGDQ